MKINIVGIFDGVAEIIAQTTAFVIEIYFPIAFKFTTHLRRRRQQQENDDILILFISFSLHQFNYCHFVCVNECATSV